VGVPTVPYRSSAWTWDDFVAAARQLTSRQVGPDGQPLVFGTNVLHSWYGYWVHGHGGEVLTPDLKKLGLALPSGHEPLQWIADLVHKHRVHPHQRYTGQSGNSPSSLFVAAFRGGARGVILSRKYSEMRLANLSGAGAALRELGYA
jgi:ABC-type glycerol-3-phosphate transport system substrate-binding protein